MAHISGLVAAGLHPNPCEYADIVTSTTHKTLRGPRAGIILAKEKYGAAIDKNGLPRHAGRPAGARDRGQGGLLPGSHAAGVRRLIRSRWSPTRRRWPQSLMDAGFRVVSGGTDTHLMLVDVFSKGVRGKEAEAGARPRPHHGQQERHSVRRQPAAEPQRHPPGQPGRHHARLPRSRNARGRRADRRGAATTSPTRTPSPPCGRRSRR